MELKNAKHERFCREYIIDLNATQAYIRVGYKERGADASASRLLGNVKIKDRIAELSLESIDKLEMTAARVLEEIGSIAFHDITGIGVVDGKPLWDAIRIPDKLKALDMLGKHFKLFTEKHEVKVTERIDFSDWSEAQILEYINKNQENK